MILNFRSRSFFSVAHSNSTSDYDRVAIAMRRREDDRRGWAPTLAQNECRALLHETKLSVVARGPGIDG